VTFIVNATIQPQAVAIDANDLKARIYTQIKPDLDRVEAEIQRHLNSSVPLISVVGNYIMKSGGKRLRPLLMILSARLSGYRGNQDATLAVVFEFIHAATLLHDDVVDNAEVRRTRAAANTIWGNPAVVLVGDFLYSKAILLTVGYDNIKILQVLSEATTRMSEGEVLQLIHSDDLETDEQAYMEVIERKTAVLMSAACQIGGIFGGADSTREKALRDYGYHLGVAFQLVDDTLDYTGDTSELGKPVGNDIQEGKATLPLIAAFRQAPTKDRDRIKKIFSADAIGGDEFREVVALVRRNGGIEYTERLAREHVLRAKRTLDNFPEHPSKAVLTDIADYVICRRT